MRNWYDIDTIDEVDSPSLVLYEERLNFNLRKMLEMVNDDPSKLMPHIKTNKTAEVIRQMVNLGIKRFKASTIAEAELAAREGADSVLVAHQLVGPKINRFIALIQHFPTTKFAAILDNTDSLLALEKEAMNSNVSIDVYIDINNGMDRTGIEIGQGLNELIDQIKTSNTLKFKGLHVYDGQFRDSDYDDRHAQVEGAMQQVLKLYEDLKNESKELELVCGGTPTFSSHLFHAYRICSPGTCVFWDWGYDEKLSEQNFQYAVLIVTRIISKPTEGIITIDLGHKSVGSENPIDKRVKFLNLSNYSLKSQSEEHGVLEVDNWDELKVGEVLFGVPFHICPTVNLHDAFSVISNGKKVDQWQIAGRQRKITI